MVDRCLVDSWKITATEAAFGCKKSFALDMPALVVLSTPWDDSSSPYAHSKAATTTAVKSNKGVALDNRDPIESNIALHHKHSILNHIVGIVSDLMEDSCAGHRLN